MSMRVDAIEGPDVLCTVVDGGSLGSRCVGMAGEGVCGAGLCCVRSGLAVVRRDAWASQQATGAPQPPTCPQPAFARRRRHLNIRGKSANLPAITTRDWADIKWGIEASFFCLSSSCLASCRCPRLHSALWSQPYPIHSPPPTAPQAGVDYFALSFVRDAGAVLELKAHLAEEGASIGVLAKIESAGGWVGLGQASHAGRGVRVGCARRRARMT